MKADIAGKIEYGTLLEFLLKETRELRSQEFWGIGHSDRAVDYLRSSNLLEKTATHKFSPLSRDVA